ncbi:hypothetical protein [Marinicella sp. W31]|uniref:hypothetical protein n=1 Tax=Marinicella sp. W31 TaxID=3023713 RepID=UPI003756B6D3
MKILLIIGVFFLFSHVAVADFIVSGECNSCSVEQAQKKAALYKQANREGTVYIFDYGYSRIHTFKVKTFKNPKTGKLNTATKSFLPSLVEIDLFANMTVLKNKRIPVILKRGLGYDSVDSVIGCGSCEDAMGTKIINTHTSVLMAAELSKLATQIFNASEYHLNYKVDVTFSDGSSMLMHMVGGHLKAVKGSIVYTDDNLMSELASAF